MSSKKYKDESKSTFNRLGVENWLKDFIYLFDFSNNAEQKCSSCEQTLGSVISAHKLVALLKKCFFYYYYFPCSCCRMMHMHCLITLLLICLFTGTVTSEKKTIALLWLEHWLPSPCQILMLGTKSISTFRK